MLKNLTPEKRLLLLQKTVCIGLIAGMVLSYNLWLSDRFFPLAPVFDFIPPLPSPLDGFAATLLLFLLLNNSYNPKKLLNHFILVLLVLLCLQDQSRWQPWVYLYLLFLIPFSLFKPDAANKSGLLQYCQFILIAVYIWSGIHKLHPGFVTVTFGSILSDLFRLENENLIHSLLPLGYGIGLTEILTGLLLFIPKTRHAGVWLAAASHLFILVYLSPLGINHNAVVFPWNMAMIVLVFLSFYNAETKPVFRFKTELKLRLLSVFILLVTWFLPVFSFFGFWDNYLSFALYSGKVSNFYIVVGESEIPKIDARFKAYFKESEQVAGGEIIDVNAWSWGELNVPFYPESRIFKQVSKSFCKLNIADGQLYFLEFKNPSGANSVVRFTCSDLNRNLGR